MLNSPKISTESGYANPVAQQVRNIAIVDDSLVMRSVVRRIIDKSPAFHIAGDFGSAGAILDFLADNVVDIIILDIEMPQRNGLDAIPDILKLCPAARILVLSSHCETGGAAVVKALALGACDTMEKPNNHFYAGDFSDQLIERLTILSADTKRPAPMQMRTYKPVENRQISSHKCLAIGSSTGGINALIEFLPLLDKSVNIPIFITQHLQAAFVPSLVEQMQEKSGRKAFLAEQDMVVNNGCIYVAPGDAHLCFHRTRHGVTIDLTRKWPQTAYCPSVDPMLASIADCYGQMGCSIMFSGMGNDGLAGAKLLSNKGGLILAQSAESSIVWGMPGSVTRAGIADKVMSPSDMAKFLSDSWKGL